MSFISANPTPGQVDVNLDVVLRIVFSKQLNDRSLGRNTLILIDDVASRQLNCSYGQAQLPDGTWEVTILPQRMLATNTAHKLYIIGADDTTAPFPTTFVDASTQAVSVELSFKTGEGVAAGLDSRDRDSVVNFQLILDGTTDLSAFMPTGGPGPTDVQVASQYPAEGDIAVRVDTPSIWITFNGAPLGYGPLTTPDATQLGLAQAMRLTLEPVLTPHLLFSPKTTRFYRPAPMGQPAPTGWGVPAGVWSIVGNSIRYTLAAGEFWPANAVINVTIAGQLVVQLGGAPRHYGVADHTFKFATEVYPAYTHTNMIRSMMGAFGAQISDLNIQQQILLASMQAYRYSRRTERLYDPSWTAQTYARIAATLSIMDTYALTLDALRGRNMKLGDLSISYMPNKISTLGELRADMEKDLPVLIEALAIEGGGGGQFMVGMSGNRVFKPRYYARNWDLISRVPWANTAQERSLFLATPGHVPVLEMY